jgi:hypothetical protein
VQLPADSLFSSMVAEAFRAHGHEPPRPAVVTDSEYLKNDFLAKGRFLTVLPSFMLKVPGWHPRLKALPIALSNTRADRANHLEGPDADPARATLLLTSVFFVVRGFVPV